MKRNVMLLCCCVACLIFMVAYFVPLRPVVTITNNTGKVMYIYAGESIYGVEPEPDEVVEIVKSKPDVLASGKELKLTASFMSLIRKDAAIDIGWRIGGQYEYNSTGGGGQNFLLSSSEGACSVSIKIQDGVNKAILDNDSGDVCLKKIKAFQYTY